jgi:hypothetical protein
LRHMPSAAFQDILATTVAVSQKVIMSCRPCGSSLPVRQLRSGPQTAVTVLAGSLASRAVRARVSGTIRVGPRFGGRRDNAPSCVNAVCAGNSRRIEAAEHRRRSQEGTRDGIFHLVVLIGSSRKLNARPAPTAWARSPSRESSTTPGKGESNVQFSATSEGSLVPWRAWSSTLRRQYHFQEVHHCMRCEQPGLATAASTSSPALGATRASATENGDMCFQEGPNQAAMQSLGSQLDKKKCQEPVCSSAPGDGRWKVPRLRKGPEDRGDSLCQEVKVITARVTRAVRGPMAQKVSCKVCRWQT